MDAAEFHNAVYENIRRIPYGRVTSYSAIARLAGMPRNARQVGQILKLVSPDATPPIPWHRVISASGVIVIGYREGVERQVQALEAEGIEVTVMAGGKWKVNMREWEWHPELEIEGDEDE